MESIDGRFFLSHLEGKYIHDNCAIFDASISIVDLQKWEMEVDAFMDMYKEKQLEHSVQIQTLQKHVGQLMALLGKANRILGIFFLC